MRLKVTAHVEINGEWKKPGDVVDVAESGLMSRLFHMGQAVPADPAAPEADQADTNQPEEATR